MNLPIALLASLVASSAYGTAVAAKLPFEDETLRFNVNWPSGLSLGEAELAATRQKAEAEGERFELRFRLDASIPSFHVADRYRSVTAGELCSTEFEKEVEHGTKKARELTTFDSGGGTATRETLGGGGKSEIQVRACARDALAFLYHVRSELASGRIPPQQDVLFGASYNIRLEYLGRQAVRVGGATTEADRMQVNVKGTASDTAFEIYFALDAVRTPVLARVPLPMGTFTLELVR
jgi:hypothetical protein